MITSYLRLNENFQLLEGNFRKFSSLPFNELNVIDFGAGSGAYDELLLSRGIGEITLVDASEKMLVKAREKLKNAGLEDRATCVKSRLDELEYDE